MRFLLPALIILLFSACLSQPDCLVTASNFVRIDLKRTDTNAVNTVKFIVIRVQGTDTLFYQGQSVSSLVLPVNPVMDLTTFYFKYKSNPDTTVVKNDSLTLSYVRQYKVISTDCGGYIYYSGLKVSYYSFANEPKVVNPQLLTSAAANLEIKL